MQKANGIVQASWVVMRLGFRIKTSPIRIITKILIRIGIKFRILTIIRIGTTRIRNRMRGPEGRQCWLLLGQRLRSYPRPFYVELQSGPDHDYHDYHHHYDGYNDDDHDDHDGDDYNFDDYADCKNILMMMVMSLMALRILMMMVIEEMMMIIMFSICCNFL